jgi:signal transduction histidine kinase
MLAQDDEHYRMVQAMAPASLIAVPLVARERSLGVLTFLLTQPGRHYGEADLALAAELADRCALAVDNAELYKAAQDAVRVREDFLAVASHELKTPLTPLLLQIHLIERRLPKLFENEESAAWLSRSLTTLQRQGRRLDRLVNELLDISRIAGGQLQLKREPVVLREVVDDVAGRLEEGQEAPASRAWLTVRGPDGITGHWDRLRLDQVIMNLLSNALKYGEGNPVELTMSSDGSHALIEVADRGMGIEPEHLQRVFGRFERAVSARQYGGLGLGLYIASQIVAAMGGTIGVASRLGEGSTFTVRLPLENA